MDIGRFIISRSRWLWLFGCVCVCTMCVVVLVCHKSKAGPYVKLASQFELFLIIPPPAVLLFLLRLLVKKYVLCCLSVVCPKSCCWDCLHHQFTIIIMINKIFLTSQ